MLEDSFDAEESDFFLGKGLLRFPMTDILLSLSWRNGGNIGTVSGAEKPSLKSF